MVHPVIKYKKSFWGNCALCLGWFYRLNHDSKDYKIIMIKNLENQANQVNHGSDNEESCIETQGFKIPHKSELYFR